MTPHRQFLGMASFLCLLSCGLTGFLSAQTAATISSSSTLSLFDGTSLNGWTQKPANSWTVKDASIASLVPLIRSITSIRTTRPLVLHASIYRLIFSVRHISGNKDHQPCLLFWVASRQPWMLHGRHPVPGMPNGGHWDYRPGHNNGGGAEVYFATSREVR